MTKTQTIAAIKALGLSCRNVDGEYRVAFFLPMPSSLITDEASAYYTDDAEDALDTAKAMLAVQAAAALVPLTAIESSQLDDDASLPSYAVVARQGSSNICGFTVSATGLGHAISRLEKLCGELTVLEARLAA